jgi:hypothetical protein
MDEQKETRKTVKTMNTNNKCKQIRDWLNKAIGNCFSLNAEWVQNHIANCPKCQRRFAAIGKVNLALSAVKSQPHKLDLLMRANTQAIRVLKHSLRQTPKAMMLKTILPEPKKLERWSKYTRSVANAAACIAILLLMKMGIFSSMDKLQTESQKAIKQYYASHLGNDMADELFQKETLRQT